MANEWQKTLKNAKNAMAKVKSIYPDKTQER